MRNEVGSGGWRAWLVGFMVGSLAVLGASRAAATDWDELDRALRFEGEHEDGQPQGWRGGPPETVSVDGNVVQEGKWSLHLERDEASAGQFSVVTRVLPVEFGGGQVELRGQIKTEDVEGRVGLWMRQDGSSGMLTLENMAGQVVSGTNDWAPYSITMRIEGDADRLLFGALLVGTGRAWVDDLKLLVDGQPIAQAPERVKVETILDTDTEFFEGAGVELGDLSAVQVESLVLLGKVWGFLKHHHPRVAAGELHWDYELFRVLPSVLEASNATMRNAALLSWLKRLGPVTPCSVCAFPPEGMHLLPEIDWIRDRELLGDELSVALEHVHANRPASKQFFVGQVSGAGNPDFSRELGHGQLDEVDAGHRLLALYRFWTIIEYWFPYRDLIEEDRDDVMRELIPVFAAAEGRDAYRRALLRLIARVHDTHANLWSGLGSRPPVGECSLPVDLRFVEGKPVVVRLAHLEDDEPSGLQVGDALLSMDGRSVKALVNEWSPYYAASNEPTRRRDLARAMNRGACGPCRLVIDRDGKRRELSVTRVTAEERRAPRRWQDREGETFQVLGERVGYLKLSDIKGEDIEGYIKKMKGLEGFVIDIRNYPSDFTVFELGQRLIKEPTEFVCFTIADLSNPGAFRWRQPLSLTPTEPAWHGKVVVLVDEVSQSSAEYTAMAFRASPNAIVIGSTTAAADGNVSAIALPGGERTMISGIGVFYPDKTPTQRIGIVPDITVRPTREGIRQGRDEVLERALAEILGKRVKKKDLRRMAARP
ncbi:MAG: S41 family peptidase [Acidobacteriota bacterium]